MNPREKSSHSLIVLFVLILSVLLLPQGLRAQVAPIKGGGAGLTYNVNEQSGVSALRPPTAAQQEALGSFRTTYGPQVFVRWDDFAGSPDALWDFRTASYSGTPAEAARAFIAENQLLFGVTDLSTLEATKSQAALGGYLVRFDQLHQGVPVRGGGIGVVLNSSKQVIAAFGPYYSVSGVHTAPLVTAADAVARARAELAPQAVELVPEISQQVAPGLDLLEASLGPFKDPAPELVIFPTADGFRLAWEFILYSRNPFAVLQYTLNAESGELLARQDKVLAQITSNLTPATGDIFPTHPGIDKNLQDAGIIPRDSSGRPLGQLRVNLRNFDASNRTTGAYGELTGTHAHVHNALAVKAPFAQPPLGTWHFAQDVPPVEQATREDQHFGAEAEPAEHQDEINIFFFINYLLEYVTDLHIRGDRQHNPLGGEGDFPDTFPNKDVPLQGIVHLPCPPGVDALGCASPEDPDLVEQALGLDNAFSLPLVANVGGQEVVVNPTMYGHGYFFNSFGVEDGVPYHEGMHSVSTPIAGFEGGVESGALNEGQADLWAQTISQDPSLGEYVVNGFRLREAVRNRQIFAAADGDPDVVAWIRNANSGLLYSQLCRFNRVSRAPDGRECEVHQDGEIYAAAMWDVRELVQLYETGGGFLRPDLITGSPTVGISVGQETWERLFLGQLYILGIMAPDNFVRARDAMILADALLYPSGLAEPGNPSQVGMHRTLIEHVFAARELGMNARGPIGGRQTVSSGVSAFTAARPAPSKAKGVKAAVFGDAVQVSWKPVTGALAYQVKKRRKGQNSGRLFPSAPATHEYFEGDAGTDGSGHVDFVPGSQTTLLDRGQIVGFFRERGLENPKDFQYAVRALALNPDNTIGVSGTEFVDAAEGLETTIDTEIFTGLVPIGTAGAELVGGVDHVDIEFFGKPGTLGVDASLSVELTDLGVLPDVDFYLYQVGDAGELTLIGRSESFGPNEFISAALVPGGRYLYRVTGFVNGPTLFTIKSEQYILASAP